MVNLNFDFLLLKEFVKENSDFLIGARLQKIQQPTRQELIFSMRKKRNIDSHSKVTLTQQNEADNILNANRGETKKFYINTSPKFFHLCFMGVNGEKRRMLEIPKQPPMFCMLLRKYLEGAKIAKVAQPEHERILEFYFETYNELSEKIYLCLAIELMGKHSNVVLYNYDTNMIIGCMHNVGAEKSSVREIIGGLPYAYPPRSINNNFSGLSSILSPEPSINESIDNYFAPLQEAEKIRAIKSRLLTLTKTKFKKTITALGKIEKQSTTSEKADSYRKKGDLIMANLFNNKDFSPCIEVMDYEENLSQKIVLDETKTLKENANQFYKLYNKAKIANAKSQEMIKNLLIEKEYLEQILYSIENAITINDFIEIKDEMKIEVKSKKEKVKSSESTISLLTIHYSPFTIFVGKNNKQNDYIVSNLARDEDLWFHVHNCAGSHVLLRVEAGQVPTDEIIFECAKLAKEHSIAKDSSKVGVIYTKRKFLKKPTGANLGYVTFKNEKEIIVD